MFLTGEDRLISISRISDSYGQSAKVIALEAANMKLPIFYKNSVHASDAANEMTKSEAASIFSSGDSFRVSWVDGFYNISGTWKPTGMVRAEVRAEDAHLTEGCAYLALSAHIVFYFEEESLILFRRRVSRAKGEAKVAFEAAFYGNLPQNHILHRKRHKAKLHADGNSRMFEYKDAEQPVRDAFSYLDQDPPLPGIAILLDGPMAKLIKATLIRLGF